MNILLITWHDLGCHLGCYGRGDVRSPNVDRLATEGTRFANYFATAPVCSPARGSTITGRYPHVNGLQGLTNRGWALNPGEKTVEGYLHEAGFRTAMIGHQHETHDAADFAFDEIWTESKQCDDVAPRVAQYFRTRRPGDKPFFARIGFFQVHRPLAGYPVGDTSGVEPLPYLPDCEPLRRQISQYHACIEHADRRLGDILDALAESGLDRDTLVIFTTDHGIPFPRAKGSLYDSGLRVALIARMPEVIAEGAVCDALLSNVDLLPTVLDLAGVEADLSAVNGKSFAPVLDGSVEEINEEVRGEFVGGESYVPKRCVRTRRHKYIANFERVRRLHAFEQEILRTDLPASLPDAFCLPVPVEELYDLAADPDELRNLAVEPVMLPTLQEMRERLRAWMEATDDPLLRGPIVTPNYAQVMASLFAGPPPAGPVNWPQSNAVPRVVNWREDAG